MSILTKHIDRFNCPNCNEEIYLYRLPRDEKCIQVDKGRSYCPYCKVELEQQRKINNPIPILAAILCGVVAYLLAYVLKWNGDLSNYTFLFVITLMVVFSGWHVVVNEIEKKYIVKGK